MVESDAVRKALGVVGVGKEMLHSSVDVLLEALAGFQFLPNEGQQTVLVISKIFFMEMSSFLIQKRLLLRVSRDAVAPSLPAAFRPGTLPAIIRRFSIGRRPQKSVGFYFEAPRYTDGSQACPGG